MDTQFSDLAGGTALGTDQISMLREFAASSNLINAVSMLEITTYMTHNLLRETDQASMAHSLEVSVPVCRSCRCEHCVEPTWEAQDGQETIQTIIT